MLMWNGAARAVGRKMRCGTYEFTAELIEELLASFGADRFVSLPEHKRSLHDRVMQEVNKRLRSNNAVGWSRNCTELALSINTAVATLAKQARNKVPYAEGEDPEQHCQAVEP
eukprot:TRINITY_DN2504_c0_g1_i2.p6 TRINITY_DN2504_c0_g1~~TRINITY_DN2504_c0_g1_i2.p6  ORF type:complete len:113 (+),score=9.54 TRINITY_DN2504_c0_g1_i2:824-1162(+)